MTPRAHGSPATEDPNLLIHADHVTALAELAPRFRERVRCVYLDPPYNTGRTFEHYDDAWDPEDWRKMLTALLEGVHPLLADDGALFLQIGDVELGQALTAIDRIFGRKNRRSIITVVRSAATGHKAKNPGPVNVTEFLLLYTKNRAVWRGHPQVRARADLDPAYSSWIVNPESPPAKWRYQPLARTFAKSLGHASPRLAVLALGRLVYQAELRRFALKESRRVVRFAQPRYEAIGEESRRWVDRSRACPEVTLVLDRPGYKALILHGGDRVLFLSDKVRDIEGEAAVVEPLTNLWDDVGYQGIAREGGVRFPRSKKPERLMARVLSMASAPGDWVLDPCLGSGTTTAVAHTMNRRWIGIERGTQMDELVIPRMQRVVAGEDPTGITRATGWAGGGGFRVVS